MLTHLLTYELTSYYLPTHLIYLLTYPSAYPRTHSPACLPASLPASLLACQPASLPYLLVRAFPPMYLPTDHGFPGISLKPPGADDQRPIPCTKFYYLRKSHRLGSQNKYFSQRIPWICRCRKNTPVESNCCMKKQEVYFSSVFGVETSILLQVRRLWAVD